jgi:hypothetical protein
VPPFDLPPDLALAAPVTELPPDTLGGWEAKLDGWRCCARTGSEARLWSRRRKDLSVAFSEIVQACGQLPDAVLDGELIAVDSHGALAFTKLASRSRGPRPGEAFIVQFQVFDIAWQPDPVPDDQARTVMLATALLGAAEAHLVGAELDAYSAGADVQALRAAYGPVREEVVATAMPPGPGTDPRRLLLTVRAAMLLDDLARAAGPDEQHPDSETLAATRDAAATVAALLAYHYGPDPGTDQPPQRESLSLAAALLHQLAGRLALLARDRNGPAD